ncbi:hypothetical protein HF1_05630 [Mycoplasma haemofelis str. Langford 1]|uniref:Lipoprotein n=1 Tax=Mycoplasma haemofelis (strain Langford 1) TaxID=941640 RepID=E8ZHF0_MYCHL|nr:hypothetical protein [Mycoplasma haemofelis]CBY92571.1 hypothetical protein HF1_05630 [Mycoplasma haemofelis str. Langford 1]
MTDPLTKVALAVGSAGVAGASCFGVWKALNGSSTISLKEKILSSHKDDFSKFLSLEDTNWSAIKTEYEKQGTDPKPMKNGKPVTKDELPSWCVQAIASPFDEKDASKLNAAIRWCYVNTNSFEQQAQALNKSLHGEKTGGDASAWQTAWESTYKENKANEQWKISDGDNNLNLEDKTQGGTALQSWCSTKSSITMFSHEAKATFPKFEKFCLKSNS